MAGIDVIGMLPPRDPGGDRLRGRGLLRLDATRRRDCMAHVLPTPAVAGMKRRHGMAP